MNATNRALMNVTSLDILGFIEGIGGWLIRSVLKPINALRMWNRVQKDSRTLLNMSDHMLKDIGVSRDEVISVWREVL